jgi:amino acid transporter
MEGKVNTKNLLRQNAIWLVFLVEVIFFAVCSNGTFVPPNNITNILRQVSYYGIASVGMTFVILIGGIDLSIGSIITLVNMVCAFMMVNMNCHWTIAVLASLIIGVIIGWWYDQKHFMVKDEPEEGAEEAVEGTEAAVSVSKAAAQTPAERQVIEGASTQDTLKAMFARNADDDGEEDAE